MPRTLGAGGHRFDWRQYSGPLKPSERWLLTPYLKAGRTAMRIHDDPPVGLESIFEDWWPHPRTALYCVR